MNKKYCVNCKYFIASFEDETDGECYCNPPIFLASQFHFHFDNGWNFVESCDRSWIRPNVNSRDSCCSGFVEVNN